MSDEIKYPSGFGLESIVAWGNSGLVCLDSSSNTVVKTPHDSETENAIAIERKIYERFNDRGGHDGVLQYLGPYESGIRLRFACNLDVRSLLRKRADEITLEQRLSWAGQISAALSFVHSAQVIHGDLTCSNVFLDHHLNAKLGDFGGSSLDGSPLLIAITASHRYPGPALSTQGDIFALGSTLYEIMTGATPYNNLPEKDIIENYSRRKFPDTTKLSCLGDIIRQCWESRYKNAGVIAADIEGVRQRKSRHTRPDYMPPSILLLAVIAVGAVVTFASLRKMRYQG